MEFLIAAGLLITTEIIQEDLGVSNHTLNMDIYVTRAGKMSWNAHRLILSYEQKKKET